NNKIPQPLGQGPERIIAPNTSLSYTINFQNTGTDTAFLVVIRDTLPSELQSSTFRPKMSSHNYQVSLEQDSILIFTFPQIMLPDSNVNLLGSQGFVDFDIEMVPDLPLTTVIRNRAGIYFDFNDPIITDWAFHTLGIPTAVTDPPVSTGPLKVYPNPARHEVFVEWPKGQQAGEVRYSLLNLTGHEVQQGYLPKNGPIQLAAQLPSGIYYLRYGSDDEPFGTTTFVKL
ncbi:MAG: T9SS type A sorting domain-containing protein, partial [Bacteroidota bacterium]